MRKKPIIAIDGPVGVGKSTVARGLAQKLNFVYIDTGAMYRAITLKTTHQGIDPQDLDQVAILARHTQLHFERIGEELRIFCDGTDVSEDIRLPDVSRNTSSVADNPGVRERLVAMQQEMGQEGGIVMEGRDISTVVFPDAEIKIYLNADEKVRAQRRYDELLSKGKKVTWEETYQDLLARDERDRTRPVGALKKADDAMEIDATHLNQEEVIQKLYEIVQQHMEAC